MMLDGKVAIVTGGGRGIGRSVALLLAAEGAEVIIIARTRAELVKTTNNIRKSGRDVLAKKCDVRKVADIRKAVSLTIRRYGRIDILVNNAGVVYSGSLHDMNEKEIDEQIDTNLRGLLHFSRIVLPHMIKRGDGVIVNVSSGAGHYAFENLAAYCATKFGVLAVTAAVAREVSHFGVKVFAVCPGAVATKMQEGILGRKVYGVAKHVMIKPEKIAGKVLDLIKGTERISSGGCVNVYF